MTNLFEALTTTFSSFLSGRIAMFTREAAHRTCCHMCVLSFAAVFGLSMILANRLSAADDQALAGSNQAILKRIRRDWAERSSRIKTLIVKAKGTDIIKAGSFKDDPDLPPGYPGLPKDYVRNTRESFWVDYSRGCIRREAIIPYGDLTESEPRIKLLDAVWAYDGKHVFFHERSLHPRTGKNPDLTIAGPDNYFWGQLDISFDPLSMSVGNVNRKLGATLVTNLRGEFDWGSVQLLGDDVLDGRRTHRLKADFGRGGYVLFDVDSERNSLVLRGRSYSSRGAVLTADIRLKYRQHGGQWQLQEWTSSTSDGRIRRLIVTEYSLNQPIPADLFRIDETPGMMVSNFVRRSYYRVQKDGNRVLYSRRTGKPLAEDEQTTPRSSARRHRSRSVPLATVAGIGLVILGAAVALSKHVYAFAREQ